MTPTTTAIDPQRLAALIAEEEARFVETHQASRAMCERGSAALAGGVASSSQLTSPWPVYLAEGSGSRVVDVDGNEYIDLHGGYGAVAVGHGHPKIVETLARRGARGTHFAQPTEEALEVAAELQRRIGLPLWRFNNSGTEATMAAIRLMRAKTGRDLIVKVEGSYHGHHDAVMVSVTPPDSAIGDVASPIAVAQTPGLPDAVVDLTRVVPFNDLDALERVLDAHRGEIAGMIVEPAMMNVGIVMPEDGYLQGVKDLLHAHGALLAFDEVKTGVTIDYGGATTRFGVTPDIVCLAKSIGGGVPCGAFGGTEEVMDVVASGAMPQQGTFNGNPLTMAATLTALREILVPEAYVELERLAELLRAGCDEVLADCGIAGYTTAMAARGAITYSATPVRNYRDALAIPGRIAYANWLVQLNRGVFMAPWGKLENWTISVAHDAEDVQRFVANFRFLGAQLGG